MLRSLKNMGNSNSTPNNKKVYVTTELTEVVQTSNVEQILEVMKRVNKLTILLINLLVYYISTF